MLGGDIVDMDVDLGAKPAVTAITIGDFHYGNPITIHTLNRALGDHEMQALVNSVRRTSKPVMTVIDLYRELARRFVSKALEPVVEQINDQCFRNRQHRWDGHHRPGQVLEQRMWQQNQARLARRAMAQKQHQRQWAEATAEAGW